MLSRSWGKDTSASSLPAGRWTRRTGGAPRRASTSFCTTASSDAAQVRALLEIVRPYVDEIVLAVDRRGDPDTLAACADLADQRLTFEVQDSASRLVGWLTDRCRGDWILRLDDDELPSRELLERLDELTSNRRIINYAMTRRWLYPDPDRYIANGPWTVEPQTRLFRNLPALWTFDGIVHDQGSYYGALRWSELPIYHCNLLLMSTDARERKAARYQALRDELEIEGSSVNDLYLPHRWSGLAYAPVPSVDRPLISRMLSPRPSPCLGGGAPVHHGTPEEINRFNDGRRLSEHLYRGRIVLTAGPAEVPADSIRHWQIMVENRGDEPWPSGENREPRIRAGSRWIDAATGVALPDEQARAYFTETVWPGENTRLFLGARAPKRPGDYLLEVDLVHEDVRWFGCTARRQIRVGNAAPLTLNSISVLTASAPTETPPIRVR